MLGFAVLNPAYGSMRSAAGRWFLAALAYFVSLVVVAVCAFFVVIVLAGPHAGLLPQPLEVLVLLLGWTCVLIVPVWVARWVWRRPHPGPPP